MSDIARKEAYYTLLRIEKDHAFSNLALGKLRRLSSLDASFATALVLGVTERRRALDYLIDRYTQKTPEPELLLLLRTGVFQIVWMDRVPDSAACNETVAVAQELFGAKRAGFVNAVLRSFCRDQEAAKRALSRQPAEIRYSFSNDIAALFREQYPEHAEELMEAFCRRQPLRLRVNRMKATVEELSDRFNAKADGEMLTISEHAAEAVQGAESGEYLIQGYGSQMAIRMLGAKPGETVFDVCACPGGKSLGAALDMENRGRIISMDIHSNKLPLIRKSAEKLGISIIETMIRDARTADASLFGKADRVICDVPCSGLGEISAKPEIRYKDPAAFAGLYPTQRAILAASASYVRSGGTLLYSTCTLNRQENGEIVRAFLQSNPLFSMREEHTWLPFETAGEGFYAARLVKQ